MSKAEDLAEKAYPYPAWSNETTRAIDDLRRNAFIEGYHQAEKDLKLGWEDMRNIYDLAYNLRFHHKKQKEFFEEVLKRFKAIKEK